MIDVYLAVGIGDSLSKVDVKWVINHEENQALESEFVGRLTMRTNA